jgi:hypothetical protein
MGIEKTLPNEQAFNAIHNSGGFGGGNFFRSIFRIAGIREPPSIIVCRLKKHHNNNKQHIHQTSLRKKKMDEYLETGLRSHVRQNEIFFFVYITSH